MGRRNDRGHRAGTRHRNHVHGPTLNAQAEDQQRGEAHINASIRSSTRVRRTPTSTSLPRLTPFRIIVFAILAYIARIQTINTRYLPENAGHALEYTWVQIWQQVQLTWSMTTATLPFVLGFMRNFDTNINNRSSMSAAMILGASKIASRAGTAHSRQPPAPGLTGMERRGTAGSEYSRGVMPSMPDDVHKWDQPVKYEVRIFSADDDESIDRSMVNREEEEMGIRRNDVITVRDEEKA